MVDAARDTGEPGATSEAAVGDVPVDVRLLDAALCRVAAVGIAKTTLDDVAREAGCSRATLYRYFPGKRPLLRAVVEREAQRLADDAVRAAAPASTLEDAVTAVLVTTARALADHEALRFVVTHEPEELFGHLAFDGADAVLARAGELGAPALRGHLSADRAERAAEWLARIVMSYLCTPSSSVDPTDPESARRLVVDFVVPGLVPFADTSRSTR